MDQSESPQATQTRGKPGEIIFLTIVLLALARLFPEALQLKGVFQGQWAGPGSVAQLLLVAMGAFVIMLMPSAWRQGSAALGATVSYLFSRDAVLLLVTVVAYAFIMGFVGFEIATFAFLLVAMYLLDSHKPLQKAFIALATVGVVYVIFSMLFAVILP